MKKVIFKIALALIAIITVNTTSAQTTDQFYNDVDAFFSAHVASGKVDYKAIAANKEALNDLVSQSQAIRVSASNKLDYQAFWINAYNIHVIKGIVDAYPIASPLDKKGFFDKITYSIAGEKVTLNDIENNFLRAKFNDARVHFVLVCGAVGCPPLISKAYRPETLDADLTAQTKKAINDKNFTKIGKSSVEISQIFEWYKGDFEQKGTKTIDFLNKYLSTPLTSKTKVKYYPYDWKVNKK